MAREIERLSDLRVKRAKAPGYYHDGAGLYLQVSDSGSKSWIFRYTLAGKTREMGIGSYNAFGLADARDRARAQRKLLADGLDPIAIRDAQRQQQALQQASTITFSKAAEKYITSHRKGWKNGKHVAQWKNTLETYAYPVFGKLPVQAVDTGLVMRVLEPIWSEKPETASRLRGRIERVLGWATVQGYRTGDNPARWRGHLENLLAKKSAVHRVKHQPSLPYQKMGEFMQALREQPGAAAKALEFTILTAARTGEVRGAKPEEFDHDNGVWVVPSGRMKGKVEHRVPLSPRALELVKDGGREYVFHSERTPGQQFSDMALLAVLKRMGRDDVTVHGFRSTFRTWAAERTSYPHEMCEVALAHRVGTEVSRAYQRSDMMEKRRRLMRDWERHCNTPTDGAKVTPIRKSA